MLSRIVIVLLVTLTLGFLNNAKASNKLNEVSSEEMAHVINALNNSLNDNYIFPEVSEQVKRYIDTKRSSGEYDKYVNGFELAEQLTRDIQDLSKDKHLRVYFDPMTVEQMESTLLDSEKQQLETEELEQQKSQNFGFKEVSILAGNIGYIDLRKFEFPEHAAPTLKAALDFVKHTHSLIFDLRNNGGGSPSMVQLIISHLLDDEPVLLNDIYKRNLDLTKQYWSLPFVLSERRPNANVYVLTSGNTFSAAEDFTYTLKHLKRATIIGETTGGGAHAGGKLPITDRFLVWVPNSRTINPITQTNWEGVGVKPHIEVAAKKALDRAHVVALEAQISEGVGNLELNQWYLEHKQAQLNNYVISRQLKQKYAGSYGIRRLILDGDDLYYQRNRGKKLKLTAMNDTVFMVEGKDHFRIKVIADGGEVTAIQGLTDSGSISQNARDEQQDL